MNVPDDVIDVQKFEKKMLEEIRKWREQRAVLEKNENTALNLFIKKGKR